MFIFDHILSPGQKLATSLQIRLNYFNVAVFVIA